MKRYLLIEKPFSPVVLHCEPTEREIRSAQGKEDAERTGDDEAPILINLQTMSFLDFGGEWSPIPHRWKDDE